MILTEFKLKGLTCEACVKLATRALSKIEDISEAKVDEDGNVRLTAERTINRQEIVGALAGTDYKVI